MISVCFEIFLHACSLTLVPPATDVLTTILALLIAIVPVIELKTLVLLFALLALQIKN
jgi:hypothetical protein